MQKIFFLLSIVLVFTFHVKAQDDSENVSFTDSTFVLGVVSENYTSICDDVSSYCSCYSKTLNKGTIVVVSGVKTCDRSYAAAEHFFEIFYKNKTYYIKRDDLWFSENIDYFSEISRFSEEQMNTFKSKAKFVAAITHHNKLNEALTFLENCKTKGLAIFHWDIYDESEYTDGTGFRIKFYNPTKKNNQIYYYNHCWI